MTPVEGRPRVVHVITRLIVGGAQLTTIRLCQRLSDTYDMHLVAGPQVGVEGSLHELARAGTPVHIVASLRREVNPRNDARAIGALRRLIEQLDPAIVHTHSSKAGIIGRGAALRSQVRVVHTVHGWGHTPDDSPARRTLFVGLERLAARRTDALIAVSDDVRAEGLRRRIGTPEQYHVIPEVVDLEPHCADFGAARSWARAALGLDDRTPVVGWVGRFTAQKDPGTLVAAISAVLREHPEARAVLVGDGSLRNSVERGLADPAIAARVQFTGVRHDARKLYAAFDVVVHPTLWEGQPHVIQEALAERIPVVSAAVDGTRGLIENATNGYLVAASDHAAFARGVLAILRHEGPTAPLPREAATQLQACAGEARSLGSHRELYVALVQGR